jgi:DNA-binding response OmpR family regulator
MVAQRVLVADDEARIVRLVAGYLKAAGFEVLEAADGEAALAAARSSRPDCLVLDIAMPGLDGLAVARAVRADAARAGAAAVPVIFLTARADEADRVEALESGADDYVVKPFSPRELAARVKAVLRRAGPAAAGARPIERGALTLDPAKREAAVDGCPVVLTSLQFDLLALLAAAPGRVYSRDAIRDGLSGDAAGGFDRTIDAHVKNLRKALGDDRGAPRFIGTVRGVGYRFLEPGAGREA